MAKPINEISPLDSLKKAQYGVGLPKPRRAGGKRTKAAAKRAAAARASGTPGAATKTKTTSRTARGTNASRLRKATPRLALFATDMQVAAATDSHKATTLAATSPLAALAPNAVGSPVVPKTFMFEAASLPPHAAALIPATTQWPIGPGALSLLLASRLLPENPFAFVRKMINDAVSEALRAWSEDLAENAKLDREAAKKAQEKAAEEKRVILARKDASDVEVANAEKAYNLKSAIRAAFRGAKNLRSRAVTAPAPSARVASTASAHAGTNVATVNAVDSFGNASVGLALMPTIPQGPSPESPEALGIRGHYKNFRPVLDPA